MSKQNILTKLDAAMADFAAAAQGLRLLVENAQAEDDHAIVSPNELPPKKRASKKPTTKIKASKKPKLIVPTNIQEDDEPSASTSDNLSQFRFEPQESSDGRNFGRKESLRLGVKKNLFVPDPRAESEAAKHDKKTLSKVKPSPRQRSKVNIMPVKANCDRCHRPYETDPYDVNRRVQGDDQMDNVCPRCIRNIIPG